MTRAFELLEDGRFKVNPRVALFQAVECYKDHGLAGCDSDCSLIEVCERLDNLSPKDWDGAEEL